MDTAEWKQEKRHLLNNYQIVTFDILAGEAGFEPTSTVLETAELPLFYSPIMVGDVEDTDQGVKISRGSWLPDLHLLYGHLHGLRTGDLR